MYSCTHCDAQSTKWVGRCTTCGTWGSLQEAFEDKKSGKKNSTSGAKVLSPSPLSSFAEKNILRLDTHIQEFNRVLGGGIVPGSLTLLTGEPGIGKSTLVLCAAAHIPNTLYISAEESGEQIALRGKRMKIRGETLSIISDGNINNIATTVQKKHPALVIIDSIHTMIKDDVAGEPGNIAQIRASTATLLSLAKETSIPILIIGHVTKDGGVAGPKTLEHMVDTVLSFEGDPYRGMRILRATKNRFGSTNEIGMFRMKDTGLEEVPDISTVLLSGRDANASGSIVTCLMEGARPMLVEIQALVTKTVFGYPIRKASGFDTNRLQVLTAVLEQRAGLHLSQSDIHINVVGGIAADEPAADLAVCLAIASAYKNKPAGKTLAVFGEVGLLGEVRAVPRVDERIAACERMGFTTLFIPNGEEAVKNKKTSLSPIRHLSELIAKTA